jgi:hypothetical protein
MTRQRIIEGLMLIVLALGNNTKLTDPPDGWRDYEWAFVKGIAVGAIGQLRDRLVEPTA